jgi:hypothetical protein
MNEDAFISLDGLGQVPVSLSLARARMGLSAGVSQASEAFQNTLEFQRPSCRHAMRPCAAVFTPPQASMTSIMDSPLGELKRKLIFV